MKISSYTALTDPVDGDVLPIVDVSDTSMAASGTTKKVTYGELENSVVNSIGPIDVTRYASLTAAFAAASSGDILYFPPDSAPYNSSVGLSVPTGVSISGYGARLRFTQNVSLQIDNPSDIYEGLIIDGNNDSLIPLKIGTGPHDAGGLGSKAIFRDIQVKKAATGGTAVYIRNAQNSVFSNFRISDCDLATTGLLIDDGSKNLIFNGLWPTQVNGPCIKITTSAGDQRTSKIYITGGLSEITEGVRLEDCEQVSFKNFALNGGNNTQAFHFIAGGDLNGSGPGMPSDISIDGCQIKSWTNAFHVAGNMTSLQVGSCSFQVTNVYKVENTSARITEIAPHFPNAAVKFVSVAGAVEGTAIYEAAAPPLYTDHGNTGADETITFTGRSSIHRLRLTAATVTILLSGAVNGRYSEVMIHTVQDGTGGRQWSLPTAVKSPTGTDPQPTAAASSEDWFRIWTIDGGTTYIIETVSANVS